MFSPSTLDLFAKLLADLTLNVGAPDFEEWVETVVTAKRELTAAQNEVTG